MADALQSELKAAKELVDKDPKGAIAALRKIIWADASDTEVNKVKEVAITALTDVLATERDAEALKNILSELRPLYDTMPKAKTAKIVRTVIDALARVPDTTELQIEVCKEQIEWARQEKRSFLRQRIEMRLAALHLDARAYPAALELVGTLLTEVKRLDDKLLLVDLHLLESRVHHALLNTPKSKAALTAARTAANAIYVPPSLQAEIDLQSGILNAEERDYKTAYSYFFEAFEQYASLGAPKALPALKYMLLCKVMSGAADDVAGIVASKAGLKYTGTDVEAMKVVAKAKADSSLNALKGALGTYKQELEGDPVVRRHLSDLFKALLEQNLQRIIEPYSHVEIGHIAALIDLDAPTVERELSQMILDKKVAGTLDQGTGCLEIFDVPPEDKIYPTALEIIKNMGGAVDSLFARSQKLVM